jgi:THO complex subunit 3
MTHVAWNCDGKKLAAVGIDKVTRVWMPEKSVSETYFLIFTGN